MEGILSMVYRDSDYHCDRCGKVVDPESRHAVSAPSGDVFCNVECYDDYEADRAAAQADRVHDDARDA